MLYRARRCWGATLLIALVAVATMKVGDATAVTSPHRSTIHHRSRTAAHPGRRLARHGRARRARGPIGGVVYARNAIILDPNTDQVLYQKNAETLVPVASLTKLMTAIIFLEQKPDLRRVVDVTMAEIRGAGHTQLRNKERVSLYDLMHMSLMCSDNVATRVLARESGLGPDEFVARMNARAKEYGLTHTHFVEFTGLDERNISTASDIARLLEHAADKYLVREITTTQSYVFQSGTRQHQIVNTNRLLRSRYEISCGKTGFINEAGYCFATWIKDQGRDLIAVVLGAPTNATRFADVVRLVQHTSALSLVPAHP